MAMTGQLGFLNITPPLHDCGSFPSNQGGTCHGLSVPCIAWTRHACGGPAFIRNGHADHFGVLADSVMQRQCCRSVGSCLLAAYSSPLCFWFWRSTRRPARICLSLIHI